MDFEIRELRHPDELEDVIRLQAEVGGLPPKDTMSPITLTALTLDHPRTGWVLGAYHDGIMISFIIGLATTESGVAYGHMFGVREAYRDRGVGLQMVLRIHDAYRQSGIRKVYSSFEPLESRNAHLYLNKLGGRCVQYKTAYYHLDSGLHHGMPQDRFLLETDIDNAHTGKPEFGSLSDVLDRFPTASPEHMPEADAVLVEIVGDLRRVQVEDPGRALAWRMNTRPIFEEYINNRGMVADHFFSDRLDGEQRGFYLLRKP